MRRHMISSLGIMALLFYWTNSASGSRSELGMQFTRHPQPFTAPLGDEVYFECSLNLAAEKFAWRHWPLNSKHWGPLINVSYSAGKTSRHVVNFDDESKAGDYRCIAFYGTSGLASDPGRLNVAKIDEFADKFDVNIRIPAGNIVPITCPVPYSSPEPIVQFYKNNVLLKNSNIIGGKTMIIENAQPSDSGNYHCSAENYITTQTHKSNYKTMLQVQKSEQVVDLFFVKQPQIEYKVLKGKNITLECFGASFPVPKVTWTRLAGSLPAGSRTTSAGLSMVDVQASDRGEYHCIWQSNSRKIESVIILKVVEAPRIVRTLKGGTVSEGGEIELTCNAIGSPEPTIEWLINGEPLIPSSNVEIKGSAMIITSVEKRHAGIVQCVATNEYGSHSDYNLLRVNPKQHMSGTEARPSRHGTLENPHNHTRGNARKKNKEGHRRGTNLVPPNPPEVTRLSDVSVMVRWSVPEDTGLPISFFKVQYRELGPKIKQSKWMTANMEIPNHVRSFEVTDLQPDHTYRFRIAAVYSNNDNKPSNNSVKFHLTRMTDFDINRMPIPLLTNTEALGPNCVLLIWQNPNREAEIDGFYVYHRASTSAGEYIKTTVEGKTATNITIDHLQPDMTYEFKIQSFSVDAASEFSKIVLVKTQKAITEPPPISQVLSEDGLRQTTGNTRNGSLYAIIGGAVGGVALLGVLAAVVFSYKRNSIKQNRELSQNEGKAISNGRIVNGVADSKINITSNPLAVLDTTDSTIQPKSGQQPSMEMTSFVHGQNNNTTNGNDAPAGSMENFNGPRSEIIQANLPPMD